MPKIKITVKQWERLLKRLMERENVQPSVGEAKYLLQRYQPPPSEQFGKYLEGVEPEATGEYGRLLDYTKRIGAGIKGENVYKGEILPLQEARSKALAEPERYEPLGAIPPVNRLSFEAPKGAPGELAEGVAYERMKFKGLSDVSRTKKVAEEMKPVLAEASPKAELEGLSPLVKLVAEADDLWRGLGGKRAAVNTIWNRYWQASRIKSDYFDAKSYFTSQYIRWRTQKGFDKKWPRESAFFKNQLPKAELPMIMGGAGLGAAGMGQSEAPPEVPEFGGGM